MKLDSFLAAIVAVLLLPAYAKAATLSMRFAGGDHEVTLASGEISTLEILITMGPNDGPERPCCLTQLDLRFDVGSVVDSGFGPYVEDGSTDLSVVDHGTPVPCFTVMEPTSLLGIVNGDFFFSVGAPNCVTCPVSGGGQGTLVVATLQLMATRTQVGDVYLVFRNQDPLPTLYNGPAHWLNRFGYEKSRASETSLYSVKVAPATAIQGTPTTATKDSNR